ncbi:hypothetical protein JB92DRAFT_2908175 [Gautieria morchelliformis]|nr:hypothetical protein JB92DRAFT_2908175 [Gautieria morchelliformis]
MSQASALISTLSQLQKTNLSTGLGQCSENVTSRDSHIIFLYLASRYYGLSNLLFQAFMTLTPNLSVNVTWTWFDAFSGTVFFTTTVNFILLLRIHALYGRNKTVLIFLLTLYFLTIRQIHFIPIPPKVPLHGCLTADHPPQLTLISWVPCLVIACVFFFMTLYKFYTFIREAFSDSGVRFPWEGRSLAPVTSLFLRDGALFFAIISSRPGRLILPDHRLLRPLAVILLNALLNVVVKSGPLIGVGCPCTSHHLLGSRLILNLRSASGRVDILAGSHMVLTESVSQRDPVFARAGQDSAPSTVTTTA